MIDNRELLKILMVQNAALAYTLSVLGETLGNTNSAQKMKKDMSKIIEGLIEQVHAYEDYKDKEMQYAIELWRKDMGK